MTSYFLITKNYIIIFDKNNIKIKECNTNENNRKIVKFLLLEDLVNKAVIENDFFFKELYDINIDIRFKDNKSIDNAKILTFLDLVNLCCDCDW